MGKDIACRAERNWPRPFVKCPKNAVYAGSLISATSAADPIENKESVPDRDRTLSGCNIKSGLLQSV